jgi:hypothetical protein
MTDEENKEKMKEMKEKIVESIDQRINELSGNNRDTEVKKLILQLEELKQLITQIPITGRVNNVSPNDLNVNRFEQIKKMIDTIKDSGKFIRKIKEKWDWFHFEGYGTKKNDFFEDDDEEQEEEQEEDEQKKETNNRTKEFFEEIKIKKTDLSHIPVDRKLTQKFTKAIKKFKKGKNEDGDKNDEFKIPEELGEVASNVSTIFKKPDLLLIESGPKSKLFALHKNDKRYVTLEKAFEGVFGIGKKMQMWSKSGEKWNDVNEIIYVYAKHNDELKSYGFFTWGKDRIKYFVYKHNDRDANIDYNLWKEALQIKPQQGYNEDDEEDSNAEPETDKETDSSLSHQSSSSSSNLDEKKKKKYKNRKKIIKKNIKNI